MDAPVSLEDHLRHHPDDERAWAVYGDVLEGLGDARGELIRLEQQLGALKGEGREKQLKAIAALVQKHKKTWEGAAPHGKEVGVSWRHGFITGLALRWTDETAPALQRFFASPDARLCHTLAITGFGEDPGDVDNEEFEEENFEDDENGYPRVKADPKVVKAAMEGVLALDLSRVVTLSFAYCQMQKPGAEVLAAATSLGGLEQLDLRYNGLGGDGLGHLLDAKFLPSLRALHLQANELGPKAAAVLSGARLPKLIALDLRHNPLQAEGATALANAPFLPQLQQLWLARHDVGPQGALTLAGSKLAPPLRSIWKAIHVDPAPWQDEKLIKEVREDAED